MISLPSADGFQQARQRLGVNAAGEIVADRAESLLARQVIFSQQAEELVNVGHGAPFVFQRLAVGGIGIFQRIGRANRQRGRRLLRMRGNQRIPGRHVGISGGVNLEQRVAVRIEELNALATVVAQVKSAGPLAEKQAQVEGARIEHQPGVAAQMLMGKFADLLMHRIFVAADAFGFPTASSAVRMARASSCRRTAS